MQNWLAKSGTLRITCSRARETEDQSAEVSLRCAIHYDYRLLRLGAVQKLRLDGSGNVSCGRRCFDAARQLPEGRLSEPSCDWPSLRDGKMPMKRIVDGRVTRVRNCHVYAVLLRTSFAAGPHAPLCGYKISTARLGARFKWLPKKSESIRGEGRATLVSAERTLLTSPLRPKSAGRQASTISGGG